jgi:hypothetical protein
MMFVHKDQQQDGIHADPSASTRTTNRASVHNDAQTVATTSLSE